MRSRPAGQPPKGGPGPYLMRFPAPLREGRLVRRFGRFFAEIESAEGTLTAHCANTGSLRGCLTPGSRVLYSSTDDPGRRLKHTWEAVRAGRTWVGVHTGRPNRLVEAAIAHGALPGLAGYEVVRREVPYGVNSRIDLLLSSVRTPDCFVEVKNVSLGENGRALFPDSVTSRGLKHLRELEAEARKGKRAVMVYCIQRTDCTVFSPAAQIDPDYAKGLARAAAHGVELLAFCTALDKRGIRAHGLVPVELA